ncbi:hypothetical protein [Phreatobacter sp.]|uniref:hypothetical protein n=1 Tax=Phreatobacter sp. TaxID=1966341 RepID=UPI003F6E5632
MATILMTMEDTESFIPAGFAVAFPQAPFAIEGRWSVWAVVSWERVPDDPAFLERARIEVCIPFDREQSWSAHARAAMERAKLIASALSASLHG